jgi:hypothetical protein
MKMGKEFIVICAWCKSDEHKVFKLKRSDKVWGFVRIPNINDYQVSDGICPECFEKMKDEATEEIERAKGGQRGYSPINTKWGILRSWGVDDRGCI